MNTCADYEVESLCRWEKRVDRAINFILAKLQEIPNFKALYRSEASGIEENIKIERKLFRLVRADGVILWDVDLQGPHYIPFCAIERILASATPKGGRA